jgi:hypothetical protein
MRPLHAGGAKAADGPGAMSTPLNIRAMRVVVIHGPEDWLAGRHCHNCHERFPCELARWGVETLLADSWPQEDVARLMRRVERGEIPWA